MKRVRGLLAIVGILAITVAVPWVLLAIGAGPIPDRWPGLDDVWGAISRPDDGTAFVAIFRYAAWVAWLFFTVVLVLELMAALVGRELPDLPGLALPQGLARSLIGTAALLFVAAPAFTTPAAAAGGSPGVDLAGGVTAGSVVSAGVTTSTDAAIADAGTATQADATDAAAEQDRAATTDYTVQPGDTLWRIAEQHLGDGTRYPEILQLNPSIGSSHWITPGSTIAIPDDGSAGDTADTGEHTRTVTAGDTLWDIAEDELGDGARYPEIVQATGDAIQPDGGRLTDPDLIHPGWEVTVPGTDTDAAASAPGRATGGPATADPTTGSPSSSTAHGADAGTTSLDAAATAGAADVGADGAAQAGSGTPEQASAPVTIDDPEEAWGQTATGLGALTAAGVLTLLGAARIRAVRRGAAGGSGHPLERSLRLAADGHTRDTVDLALRDLARIAEETGQPVPGLRSVRVTREHIDAQLDTPVQLPAPWTSTADPRLWTLAADRAQALDVVRLQEIPPPYPALVTLGHDTEGAHVLVNLAHAHTFTVAGRQRWTRASVAAMTLDLATAPWAGQTTVTVIGGRSELVETIGSPRVRHIPDVDAYVISPSVTEHTTAREVVLSSGELSSRQVERLLRATAGSPRIALVRAADEADPESWALSVGDDPERAVLMPVHLQVWAQHLDDPDVAALSELFALAADGTDYWAPAEEEVTLATVGAAAAALGSPGVVVDPGGQVVQSSDDDLPTRPRVDAITRPRRAPLRWNTPVTSSTPRAEHDTAALVETVRRSTTTGWTPTASTPRWLSTHVTPTPGTPLPPVVPFPTHVRELAPPTDDPVLRLLGPVDIDNVGEVEAAHRARLTELAAFLHLTPGANGSAVDDAMWPNRSTHDHSDIRRSALTALGRWIGGPGAPATPEGGRVAAAALTSDWSLWRQLVPGEVDEASTENLEQALGLVRGRPFVGSRSRHYVWATALREEMIATICAAAYELARRRLMEGRFTAAYEATVVGLTAEPHAEPLWRLQVLAAEELGGDLREEAVAGLRELGDGDDADLEPRSRHLLTELAALADTAAPSRRAVG